MFRECTRCEIWCSARRHRWLARRARALARLAAPNALVADAARAYARANGGAVPSTKSLNAYIREPLGISLTKRELERAAALVRDDLPP